MKPIAALAPHRSEYRPRGWWLLAFVAVGMIHLALGGCATWQAPESVDDSQLRTRAVGDTAQGVHLSAAVLSAADSRQLFGADVNGTGIQPVWVEVENSSPDTLWLLRAGTDPDYFSPLEVAWSFHTPLAGTRNAAIDDHFDALQFRNPIPAKSTRAGIIFTNPHHRTRVLNVDLLGPATMIPFTLFLPDPDNPPDQGTLQVVARYVEAQREDLDDPDAFRRALQRAPCCAKGANAAASPDPINVVFVGKIPDIAAALVRRGFRSDRMVFDDAQRLFDRPPDFVLRKAGQGGVSAIWVRGWAAPLRYRGQPVFLAQTGRPVGGRFALADGKDLALHAEVDEARNLLIQDLLYSGGLTKLGLVEGGGTAEVSQPQDSLAAPRYRTDGLRAVMFFAIRPRALSDVQLLDWVPELERRDVRTSAEQTNARQ